MVDLKDQKSSEHWFLILLTHTFMVCTEITNTRETVIVIMIKHSFCVALKIELKNRFFSLRRDDWILHADFILSN